MTGKSSYGSVQTWGSPDRGDGTRYLMPDEGHLAVEVALATGRPLLLRGKPGCGKSSLAVHVAQELNWRYYEHVVTYRTHATDLLWTYDTVRRLADAQARANGGNELNDHRYVRPGPLWWAYARDSARRRGAPQDSKVRGGAPGNDGTQEMCEEPFGEMNEGRSPHGAVVLIDEIDKADPDVPNGLLVPLGSGQFRVTETGTVVCMEQLTEPGPAPARHLVVITTNEERELPQAFLRRCVVASLPSPGEDGLIKIARAHLTERFWDSEQEALAAAVAREVLAAREQAGKDRVRAPSTAEYLDALRACLSLEIRSEADPRWSRLRDLVLVKHQQPEDAAAGDAGR
ncbi:AAA family ATPase [Streptomyces sp. NPDC002889]|uniref:AAA family ATPase n=1 Tax=Streptomyces sp. NPDC002889 TaxID=3364669 RepID=UPI0036D11758